MKHIAIIPARAGSKSIINKNLQLVGKKSLVHRAVDSALGSGVFHKIILSTDIPVLQDEFEDSSSISLHCRPVTLAGDDTTMEEVALDLISRYDMPSDAYLWVLQPTSPFRIEQDYESIVSLLRRHKASSLISMAEVGANHPNRMYTIKRNELFPLRFTNFKKKQDLMQVYIRSGHYYVVRVGEFRTKKQWYIPTCVPYIIEEERAVNIDTPRDLKTAQAVAR